MTTAQNAADAAEAEAKKQAGIQADANLRIAQLKIDIDLATADAALANSEAATARQKATADMLTAGEATAAAAAANTAATNANTAATNARAATVAAKAEEVESNLAFAMEEANMKEAQRMTGIAITA